MRKQFIQSVFGLICIIIISELALRLLSTYSLNIKFFTTNPFQQTYLSEIENGKGITSFACNNSVQNPGSQLNGFILNSHGFQSPEYPYDKPPDVKRVVFIGDSQTVSAVPYPNSFVRLLDSRLNTKYQKIQTLNLGTICVGPGTEKQILQYEGIKYQPNVIVLGFFVENDFTDDKEILQRYNEQIKTKTYLFPFWVYQSRLFSLFRNMRFYLTVKEKSPLFPKKNDVLGIETESFDFNPKEMEFTESDYFSLGGEKLDLFRRESPAYSNWNTVQKFLLDMKQLSDQANAKFLVLIIPDEFQVNKTLLKDVAQYKKISVDQLDMALPQRTIKTFFDQHNIQYIDLLTEWESSPAAEKYYLPRNTHLSIEGNKVVADTLYPKINELLRQPIY